MPPNFDVPPPIDPESFAISKEVSSDGLSAGVKNEKYNLHIFQSSLNQLAHILIGIIVGTCYIFSLRSFPLTATPLHIFLCVTGYQLLMGQAILSLSESNGWSLRLNLVDKRRAHWILQLAGSGMAIAGSFIKMIDKTVHWNTYHGQFALVALVFTSVSLFNGLSSLYAYELSGILPAKLSKLTHICFGTVAYVAANVTVCFAFDKFAFQLWSTELLAHVLIAFIAISTFIVVVSPVLTFIKRLK